MIDRGCLLRYVYIGHTSDGPSSGEMNELAIHLLLSTESLLADAAHRALLETWQTQLIPATSESSSPGAAR